MYSIIDSLCWVWNHSILSLHSYCEQFVLDEDGGGSGDDYLKVDSAWHGDIDSDADSVDSEEEDLLKWVYTPSPWNTIQHCQQVYMYMKNIPRTINFNKAGLCII